MHSKNAAADTEEAGRGRSEQHIHTGEKNDKRAAGDQ